MKTIFGKYKIDYIGNIYSSRGLLKLKLDKNHYRVNINQKWVSYARVVATYLVLNPNNYDRIIFKDRNPLNCSVDNIEWVSEKKYQRYIYNSQIKNKINKRDFAINKCKCPIIKEYYLTDNIEIINKYFVLISNKISVHYWKEVSGYVYLKVIEKLKRFSLFYDLSIFILKRLKYYNSDKYNLK